MLTTRQMVEIPERIPARVTKALLARSLLQSSLVISGDGHLISKHSFPRDESVQPFHKPSVLSIPPKLALLLKDAKDNMSLSFQKW